MANPRSNQRDKINLRHHPMDPMSDLSAILSPGMIVRHPDQPDWGEGQVQSNVGGRVTVNFREIGKVVLDGTRVPLIIVSI